MSNTVLIGHSYTYFCIKFYWILCFLIIGLEEFVIFCIQNFCVTCVLNAFPQSVVCCFLFKNDIFQETKFVILVTYSCSFSPTWLKLSVFNVRKLGLCQSHKDFPQCSFSKYFIILGLIFMSVIHFQLILC